MEVECVNRECGGEGVREGVWRGSSVSRERGGEGRGLRKGVCRGSGV